MLPSSTPAILTTVFLGFLSPLAVAQKKKSPSPETSPILFSSRSEGSLFAPITGSWRYYNNEGVNIIRLTPEPVRECRLEIGPKLRNGAFTISAKSQAKEKSRLFPKMGIGLYGHNGVALLLAPGHHRLELVQYGEVMAVAPLTQWTAETWWTLELIISAGETHHLSEARAWPSETPRPEMASLVYPIAIDSLTHPLSGRAFVIAFPYNGLPIFFDEVILRKDS